MKRVLFKAARPLLFLAIGLALLYVAFRDISLEELINSLRRANYVWVGITLFCAFLGYMSRAYRWKLLMKPLNYNPPFWNVFSALMIGYTVNFAIPRIGEITRCLSLRRSDKIPIDSLLGTVLIERASDLIVLTLVFLTVFLSKIEFFGEFLTTNIFKPFSNRIVNLFHLSVINWIVLVAVLIITFFIIRFILRKFSATPFMRKIQKLLRGVIRGVKTISRMKDRWFYLFHTLFIWGMYFLMTYLLVFAFPSTAHLKPIDGLILLVIGGIGMSVPVQGGIGVFHWIVSLGLVKLYNIPEVDSVAYATVSHESQAALAILLGAFSFLYLAIKQRKVLNLKTV